MPGSAPESANWKPCSNAAAQGIAVSGNSDSSCRKNENKGYFSTQKEEKEGAGNFNQVPGNKFQKQAICHFTGPCEVIAGPGSGKTFVIVERILHLIQYYRMDPSRILVLTFSRAAAIEMRQRFLKWSAPESYPVTFGTFHSVFYHILRESVSHPFTIISTERQKKLVRNLVRRYSCGSTKSMPEPQDSEVQHMLSLIAECKMTGKYPLSENPEYHIREILHEYDTYLSENNLIDFEDMIGQCREILIHHPDVRKYWQDRFQFLLIDEFQDINAGQFEVLRLLAGHLRNLFVVGDDDQSIYGFRGSDPQFMLGFKDWFPDASVIMLHINYRCCPEIIETSSRVIGENTNRIPKTIIPNGYAEKEPSPSAVEIHSAESETEEYRWICRKLLEEKEEQEIKARQVQSAGKIEKPEKRSNIPEVRTAIIVRTHLQLAGLIRALDEAGIPWQERGGSNGSSSNGKNSNGRVTRAQNGNSTEGQSCRGRNFVRVSPGAEQMLTIIRSYYHLAEAQAGSGGILYRADLLPVLNVPERFLLRNAFRRESYSEQELLSIYPKGSAEERSLEGLCRDLCVMGRLSPAMSWRYLKRILQNYRLETLKVDSGDSGRSSGHFSRAIREREWESLDAFLQSAASSSRSLREFCRILDEADPSTVFSFAADAGSLNPVLNHAAGSKNETSRNKTSGTVPVSLLTMHASKGLEFDTVILPDLNEGVIPNKQALNKEGIEEERRLLYVAMTRAKNRLILSYIRGTRENPRRPSRFLEVLGVKTWES